MHCRDQRFLPLGQANTRPELVRFWPHRNSRRDESENDDCTVASWPMRHESVEVFEETYLEADTCQATFRSPGQRYKRYYMLYIRISFHGQILTLLDFDDQHQQAANMKQRATTSRQLMVHLQRPLTLPVHRRSGLMSRLRAQWNHTNLYSIVAIFASVDTSVSLIPFLPNDCNHMIAWHCVDRQITLWDQCLKLTLFFCDRSDKATILLRNNNWQSNCIISSFIDWDVQIDRITSSVRCHQCLTIAGKGWADRTCTIGETGRGQQLEWRFLVIDNANQCR